MPSANPSPYSQRDPAFFELAEKVKFYTKARSLKMLILFRKRYPEPIYLCSPISKDLNWSDFWGTGSTPFEALQDLAEELGVIQPVLDGLDDQGVSNA